MGYLAIEMCNLVEETLNPLCESLVSLKNLSLPDKIVYNPVDENISLLLVSFSSFVEQSKNNSITTVTVTLNLYNSFNAFVHKNHNLLDIFDFW